MPTRSHSCTATSSAGSFSSGSPAKTLAHTRSQSSPSRSRTNSVAKSMARALKYCPNEKLLSISKKVRWLPSSPTSSMSGVRKHFWTVVVSSAGGCSRPRKNGICGCIPALVSSVERSSARGISEAEGRRRWPFSSKNERYPSRSSAVVRMPSIVRPSAAGAAGLRLLLDRDLGADLLERAADQPRHVHLRDADLLGDLGLRQALEEAKVQDRPLALVEHAEAGREHGAILGDLVLVLDLAERLERIELAVLVGAAARRERERRVGAPRLERLQHLFLLDPGRLRELGNRRRARQ